MRGVAIEYSPMTTVRLNMLEDQKAAEADIAKYEGEQAKVQKDAVVAMAKVDALTKSSWTNEQKRADALKEYRRQLDDIRKADPKDRRQCCRDGWCWWPWRRNADQREGHSGQRRIN